MIISMLHNAHAYHAIKRNENTADSLRIVGAILPDSALTGKTNLVSLHAKESIDAFISELPTNYEQLGRGLLDHHDLDLQSHNGFEGGTGYAFSHQTPELKALVADACGLTSPEQIERLTHNFIESGVDINLLRENPTIQDRIGDAIASTDLDDIAKQLATHFELDEAQTRTYLNDYVSLITSYDLRDIEGWIALWEDLIAILLNHLADKRATRKALLLATELTTNDYLQILDH